MNKLKIYFGMMFKLTTYSLQFIGKSIFRSCYAEHGCAMSELISCAYNIFAPEATTHRSNDTSCSMTQPLTMVNAY